MSKAAAIRARHAARSGSLAWTRTDPGSLHGFAPYGRIAYQNDLGGGTFEVGANILKAAIYPGRDRSSGFTDRYTDWGIDSSWLKTLGKSGFAHREHPL